MTEANFHANQPEPRCGMTTGTAKRFSFNSMKPSFLANRSWASSCFLMRRSCSSCTKVDPGKIETGARHPRNNVAWPNVGIFAQRGKNRPNQIGLTICRILKVEQTRLYLEGLDAIDGTPVLDIKPWVKDFGPRGDVDQPAWITELMQGYWAPSR